MVNGQLALKLVGMVRNLAKDKLPRLHQMGDKIVKEILRRQWLAMMSPVQVGDYIFGKKRKPLHYIMDFIRIFDNLQNIVILQSYDIPAIIGLTKTW